MKKSEVIICLVFGMALICCMSIVSAGLFSDIGNWFKNLGDKNNGDDLGLQGELASLGGEEESFIEITNCQELQNIKNNLIDNYILINDIDCSDTINWNNSKGFIPIGDSVNKFQGEFNGNCKIIKNLYINSYESEVGLFGNSFGKIYNLGLEDVLIMGNSDYSLVGGLVGYSSGFIEGCYITGDLVGSGQDISIGGLLGFQDSNAVIKNSYSSVDITGANGVSWYTLGGFSSSNGGEIINCYSTGDVVAYGLYVVGGFIGSNDGVIKNSYSIGKVLGGEGGGFAGEQNNEMINGWWYDQSSDDYDNCVGEGDGITDCNKVNKLNEFFYKTQDVYGSGASAWDFNGVWQEESEDFPSLRCNGSGGPFCGNGGCDGVETCETCPEDCGVCVCVEDINRDNEINIKDLISVSLKIGEFCSSNCDEDVNNDGEIDIIDLISVALRVGEIC